MTAKNQSTSPKLKAPKLNFNDPEFLSKIKELLLNDIENLKWNYFDIDLNAIINGDEVYVIEEAIAKFFNNIESNGFGKYTFCGTVELKEVVKIIFTLIDANPQMLTSVLKSLFKSNEISNKSESNKGLMGVLNLLNRKGRNKEFKGRIRHGFRTDPNNIVMLAEGDSWFQFPKACIDPVTDIIDWLIEDKRYAIKSLAAGGDWLSNIFYAGEYIEELPKLSPDVFLISGGGNDLIGNNRLAIMVVNTKLEGKVDLKSNRVCEQLMKLREKSADLEMNKYKRGLSFISEEFFKLLNLYFIQYFVFLYNIANHEKYRNMLIITQGYDYAIPYNKARGKWPSFHRFVNNMTDTGNWLFEPLSLKGITNPDDQAAIIYTMIYEFNEMLIQLAKFDKLKNVFHIDCRGFANEEDWFDELHLKSKCYEKIANVFKECIDENLGMKKDPETKVYVVKNRV